MQESYEVGEWIGEWENESAMHRKLWRGGLSVKTLFSGILCHAFGNVSATCTCRAGNKMFLISSEDSYTFPTNFPLQYVLCISLHGKS